MSSSLAKKDIFKRHSKQIPWSASSYEEVQSILIRDFQINSRMKWRKPSTIFYLQYRSTHNHEYSMIFYKSLNQVKVNLAWFFNDDILHLTRTCLYSVIFYIDYIFPRKYMDHWVSDYWLIFETQMHDVSSLRVTMSQKFFIVYSMHNVSYNRNALFNLNN